MSNNEVNLANRFLRYLRQHIRPPTVGELVLMIRQELKPDAEIRKENAILTAGIRLFQRKNRQPDPTGKLAEENARLRATLKKLQERIQHGDSHTQLLRIINTEIGQK